MARMARLPPAKDSLARMEAVGAGAHVPSAEARSHGVSASLVAPSTTHNDAASASMPVPTVDGGVGAASTAPVDAQRSTVATPPPTAVQPATAGAATVSATPTASASVILPSTPQHATTVVTPAATPAVAVHGGVPTPAVSRSDVGGNAAPSDASPLVHGAAVSSAARNAILETPGPRSHASTDADATSASLAGTQPERGSVAHASVGDVNVGDADVGDVSRVDGAVSRVDGDVSRVDASVGDASVVNASVADVTQRAARLLSSFRAANGSIFQRPQQDASMFDPADVVFTSSPSMMQTPGGPILGASAVSATPSTALPSPLERVMQVRCPRALCCVNVGLTMPGAWFDDPGV